MSKIKKEYYRGFTILEDYKPFKFSLYKVTPENFQWCSSSDSIDVLKKSVDDIILIDNERYLEENKLTAGTKIVITFAYFGSELASSLKIAEVEGIFKEVDNKSRYVKWTDLDGKEQPTVHLGNIRIL